MELNASTIEDFVRKNYTNDMIVKELREKHGRIAHISFRCKLIEIGIQTSCRSLKRFRSTHSIAKRTLRDVVEDNLSTVLQLLHGGSTYKTISTYIERIERTSNVKIAPGSLRRILKEKGYAANDSVESTLLVEMVELEANEVGPTVGYRKLSAHIRTTYDVNVSRDSVREVPTFLNPELVKQRQQRRLTRRTYVLHRRRSPIPK